MESVIQLKESGIQRYESGIQVPLTKNPELTAWNPEFKTVLDSLTWGDSFGSGVWRHGLELNKALVIAIVYAMPHFSTIRQLSINRFIFIYNIDVFQIWAWREGFTACCHI